MILNNAYDEKKLLILIIIFTPNCNTKEQLRYFLRTNIRGENAFSTSIYPSVKLVYKKWIVIN